MIMMFLQDEIFHQEQLWHSVDQSEMSTILCRPIRSSVFTCKDDKD